jgi:hypothetical protein
MNVHSVARTLSSGTHDIHETDDLSLRFSRAALNENRHLCGVASVRRRRAIGLGREGGPAGARKNGQNDDHPEGRDRDQKRETDRSHAQRKL